MLDTLKNLTKKLFSSKSVVNKSIQAIRWSDEYNASDWIRYIHFCIEAEVEKGKSKIILIVDIDNNTANYALNLIKKSYHDRLSMIEVLAKEQDKEFNKLLGSNKETDDWLSTIFCFLTFKNNIVSYYASMITKNPNSANSSLIFKIDPRLSYTALINHDKFRNTIFLSTKLDSNEINNIYEYTLSKVEKKCQVRDAYDLYQCLLQTLELPGAIAEFGSYRGHSGLLMAEIIKRNNVHKQIYLFDMFEEFPQEELGIDRFWNDSHYVDFNSIQKLFSEYPNVKLIKGDFTKTFEKVSEKEYSFVFVDCDSYRSIRYIADAIFPKLCPGGIMIFEDYGHEWCLGARLAVDEFVSNHDNCFTFFSGFSGVFVLIKTGAAHLPASNQNK